MRADLIREAIRELLTKIHDMNKGSQPLTQEEWKEVMRVVIRKMGWEK